MYPAELVMPMKAELTDKGFQDLTTPEQVNDALKTIRNYSSNGKFCMWLQQAQQDQV